MRSGFDPQLRLGTTPIEDVDLNTGCRCAIVPILRALQYIYSVPEYRDAILSAVAADVNRFTSAKRGRSGMSYWVILVLAAVRLGRNLTYDQLQDLAENHLRLRAIMGIESWDDNTSFDWRRIWENVCRVSPETIEQINHYVVKAGHELQPTAIEFVRGDGFVTETNVHYPTDSSLMLDGLRHVIRLAVIIAKLLGLGGWRQHKHLLRRVRALTRQIGTVSRKKGGGNYRERLREPYQELIDLARTILDRASSVLDAAHQHADQEYFPQLSGLMAELTYYIGVAEHAVSQGQRRVIDGERVPNDQKLFSVFEPDTELIRRGKVNAENEFGHRVLIFEDAAGFICHYAVLPNGMDERSAVVSYLRQLQDRVGGKIEKASLDKGFHSPENQKEVAAIVEHPCLPTTGKRPAPQANTVEFRESRQRHPGVESAIGALQSGNAMDKCRDHSQIGYRRYVGLGVLGRNLWVLGKLLITKENPDCNAAFSKRTHKAA